MEARNARKDLADALAQGTALSVAGPRLDDAREQTSSPPRATASRSTSGAGATGARAWEDLESSLRRLPDSLARRRLGDITRGDVQRFVDDMTRAGASGSRVRSVVNALRSLYRWAQDRDLVGHDPAANVRLPAMEAKPRDRVATPAEFAQLLAALEARGRAAVGAGRLRDGAQAGDPRARLAPRRPEARRRRAGGRRGGPQAGRLVARRPAGQAAAARCCARRGSRRAGRARARSARRGSAASPGCCSSARSSGASVASGASCGLEPIGLHESRHTAATWLDHAGVSPKVASTLMGHKTPEYQPGAASITLRRYTHTLPGELERARDLLDKFLVARTRPARGGEGMTACGSFPRTFPLRGRATASRRCGAEQRRFLKTGVRASGPWVRIPPPPLPAAVIWVYGWLRGL